MTPEQNIVYDWLNEEFDYQHGKWSPSKHDELTRDEGTGKDSTWYRDVTQYMHRAGILGLDTNGGKQALMKALATLQGCAESMVRVYGPPPEGGTPSGTYAGQSD